MQYQLEERSEDASTAGVGGLQRGGGLYKDNNDEKRLIYVLSADSKNAGTRSERGSCMMMKPCESTTLPQEHSPHYSVRFFGLCYVGHRMCEPRNPDLSSAQAEAAACEALPPGRLLDGEAFAVAVTSALCQLPARKATRR